MGRLKKRQITEGEALPKSPETKVCDPLDFQWTAENAPEDYLHQVKS